MGNNSRLRRIVLAAAFASLGVAAAVSLVPASDPVLIGQMEPSFAAPAEAQAVPDEILIKYNEALIPAGLDLMQGESQEISAEREQLFATEVARIEKTYPIQVVATYSAVGVQRLKVAPGESVSSLVGTLERDPAIAVAEPNYLVYALEAPPQPNDTLWPALWGMRKIQMPDAWAQTTGSADVVVAVIDTGIDYTHRDLAGNMWKNPGEIPGNNVDDDRNGIVDDVYGANFCNGAQGGDPMDDGGHGTHVAGTIAGMGNNQRDVVGVNWTARLMAIKFLCRNGSGATSDAIRGIEYALRKKAQILSNSWGGTGYSRALELIIREAERRGVLFVAAAGNSGKDTVRLPHYPSSYDVPNVLAVAATDPADRLAGFSNYGRNVHLAAPGVAIVSTVPGNRLATFNGTSMATPHVSGCAALLKARNPSLKAADLKRILLKAGDRVPGLQDRVIDGRRLNCSNALRSLR